MRHLVVASLVALTACAKSSSSPLGTPVGQDAAPLGDAGPQGGDDLGVGMGPDAGSTHPHYTWWHDVEPIVTKKCAFSCHNYPPQFGAPMSLLTYANTQAIGTTGDVIYKLMAYRIVARSNPMPPPGQPMLTNDEKMIIVDWADDGAPEGDPSADMDAGPGGPDANMILDVGPGTDAGPALDAGTSTGATVLTFTAHDTNATTPYAIPTGSTQYICWAFSLPPSISGSQHAVRFEPIVSNTAHLHHMLLFRNPMHDAQPGPVSCTSWPYQYEMVAGWAPGRQAVDMPTGVGVPVNAGDQFVLQAHYNAVTTSDQVDQSGFRMKVVSTPNLIDAGILWSGVIFGSAIMGPNVTRTGSCMITSPITIFSDFPHMHRTGTTITLDVERAGSTSFTNLVDIPQWSFDDQPNSVIDPSQQLLNVGDTLRTTCWWDTMGRSINYGEASTDEMCFNFIYHYPLMSNQYACVSFTL